MIRLNQADRQSLLVAVQGLGRLLRASDAEAASGVLIDVVGELGGTTAPAGEDLENAIPLDLSLGFGEPVMPVATPGSVERGRLEQVLPFLLDHARVAVARAGNDRRLAEQVEVDWLTGLLNRRGSDRLLHRLDAGDTVVLMDLDHFKAVNDELGHAAGDEVLAAFGRLLREHGRAEDRYGRFGGEEFLGVFPRRSVDEVVQVMERIAEAWRKEAPHDVTFSAGIASIGTGGSLRAVAAADLALYRAKEEGRDRVRVAPLTVPSQRAPTAEWVRAAVVDADSVPIFLDWLAKGDTGGATEFVHGLVDGGAGLRDVVVDVLAPAQFEVGRRWQSGEWSVADEHIATGVVDAVLAAVSFRSEPAPEPAAGHPSVVVVCPEGEWHHLPARMFTGLLGQAGIAVTHLGPSLPERDLVRALTSRSFSAVVLSCTVPTSLVAAGAAIRAAHSVGVPVLAGGPAWGPDDRRASALGADGWAADVDAAAALLRRWARVPPAIAPPTPVGKEVLLSDLLGPGLVSDVLQRLSAARPDVMPVTRGGLAAAREDIAHIVRHLDAAIVVDDPRLFLELTDWLVDVLSARGVPADAVPAAYEAIDAVLGRRSAAAHQLLLLAAEHVRHGTVPLGT